MKIVLTSGSSGERSPEPRFRFDGPLSRSFGANLHPLTLEAAPAYFEHLLDHLETDPESVRPVPLVGHPPVGGARLRLRDAAALDGSGPVTASLDQPGFPVVLGQLLAHWCERSYEPAWLEIEGNPLLSRGATFDRDHAQGLGFLFEDHAFLVFRGTDSRRDALRDLQCWRVPEAGTAGARVRVHAGFARHLDRLWEPVTGWLESLPATRGVVLAGHSLGGAMAKLAAHRLARDGATVRGVVTFGSPRTGNAAFASSYADLGLDLHTWRVTFGGDLVAQIPPAVGYRHVGRAEPLAGPRQLETDPLRRLAYGDRSSRLWSTVALALGGRSPWLYAALQALPFAVGAVHGGREHLLRLGYAAAHRARADRRLETLLQAVERYPEGVDAELLRRLHRAYLLGEGLVPALSFTA